MNRVVVTGAGGFIGRYTLPILVEAGFEVHAFYWNGDIALAEGVSWHNVNLMDYEAVDEALRTIQATHLLHLAWYTEHGKFWQADENLQWVACSLNLLKSFVEHGGGRVLMAGSCAEYDWSNGLCHERETACESANLYGTSKYALFKVAKAYCAQKDVSFAWGRIFFLYGPCEVTSRFVPVVINGILRQQHVPCSDGTQIRDFMYVKDVASAFVALLQSDLNDAVNIASGESYTLKEIGEKIMCQIKGDGRVEFGVLPTRIGEPTVLTADVGRLHNELEWAPIYSLEEGLAQTIEWWQENQVKCND